MYLLQGFDGLFKIVLNCNNEKSVLYSGSRRFRASVTDFRFARQWKTKAGQKASSLKSYICLSMILRNV